MEYTKVVSDTIIEDKLCRIIGSSTNGEYSTHSEIPVFYKDGKMYFHEKNKWWLMYDFNAETGDTVTYYLPANHLYHHFCGLDDTLFGNNLYQANPFQLVIKGIDTIYSTENIPLKRFKTENLFNFYGHYMDNIIERMGSVKRIVGGNGFYILPDCGLPCTICY